MSTFDMCLIVLCLALLALDAVGVLLRKEGDQE